MNEHQVVITGLGAVTPIGTGVKTFYEGLKAGRNGIAKVTHFDVTDFRTKLAAEVKDFQAEEWIDKKSARRMDRFTQFAMAASAMAIEEADWNQPHLTKTGPVSSSVLASVAHRKSKMDIPSSKKRDPKV